MPAAVNHELDSTIMAAEKNFASGATPIVFKHKLNPSENHQSFFILTKFQHFNIGTITLFERTLPYMLYCSIKNCYHNMSALDLEMILQSDTY